MLAVNVKESKDVQKKIINQFIKNVKEKCFLNKEDFDMVFKFFSEIADLECTIYEIKAEYYIKSNKLENIFQGIADSLPDREWSGIKVSGCDYSNTEGMDVTLFLDPVFFCKRYFGRKEIKDRLDGIIELLIAIYYEVDHAVKLKKISCCYLSPDMLEISKEIFLKEILDPEVYKENYENFSFERNAKEYACNMVLNMLRGTEVFDMANDKILQYRESKNEFSASKIGKIKYMGDIYNKNEWLNRLCVNNINEKPRFLYMFPIFLKQYNEDGKKKDIHQLFNSMASDLKRIFSKYNKYEMSTSLQQEFLDCQMFYYELILPELEFITEQDYLKLAEKYGVLFLKNLLVGMEKYFNLKAHDKIICAKKYRLSNYESLEDIEKILKKQINSIIRFRNGVLLNPIAEKLLREGGFVRGTREVFGEDIIKRHMIFANSLIGVYDAIESEDEYKQRAENEKLDIDEVVNALYYNRFEEFFKNVELDEHEEFGKAEVVRIAQILKIAKIISITAKHDYFCEFLKIPDVNRLIGMLERDRTGYLSDCMKKSQIRIKKVIYPNTEAEDDKYRDYILGLERNEESKDISEKILMLNREFEERTIRRGV